jgi:Flp pilus assembly protein TadG
MKSQWKIGKEKGGSAVEFAIILPLLLLFVFGIVEWSLYVYDKHIITNASREGARRGIVNSFPRIQDPEIRAVILGYTADNLVSFGAETPNIPPITVCAAGVNDLTVEVNYQYTFLVLPALTFGAVSETLPITASTVMRCE